MKNYSRKNPRGGKTAFRTPAKWRIRKTEEISKNKTVYLKKRSSRSSLRKKLQ